MTEIDKNDLRMRCIQKALQKVRENKYEEAIRFLKIVRQCGCGNSKVLEDFIMDLKASIRKRAIIAANSSSNDPSVVDSTHRCFIEAELLLVQEVLKQTDFYKILNVSENATEEDIRKSYKRLLLQLHPDKNHSPDAAVAFQLVSKAFAVLSDKTKRQKYDAARARGITANEFEKMKVTSESKTSKKKQQFGVGLLLDVLFAKSDSCPKYMQTFSGTNTKALLGSLLVAVFLAFATSVLMESNQLYSFTETNKFNVRQVTQNFRIPYFVKSDFFEEFKGDLSIFEREIESQFVTIADMACKNERRERDNALVRAHQSGNRWEYARIFSIRLKSCDILLRLGINRIPRQELTTERWNF